ncbi:nucleotidyltransferase [Tumebacillus sp. ITR2]|uniref:Nucleotidyltransferase n=1 Tax=Tumebacillus amylolyticus TaxID=2801339 RepID=A0ABS1JDX5_9BACL|nr:nucleotidyltransferase [Tumebacillus amylolyticus]MBL0388493.1 nucleotidyltransferase [Tumebacillus amylolyticus]
MKRDVFDNLLHRIGGKLQISDTQRDLAKGHYEAVGRWLAADENLYSGADMQIYAQGSLRIGTTVKPISGQEFDLDIVCEFDAKWRGKDSIELLRAVEHRLRMNKTYAPMVQVMKRCVRLNYANDFHMDILPAVPADDSGNGCLKVPDRKLKDWKDSNPKGYADWFEKEAERILQVFMEKSAEIEPFPDDETFDFKPPLKRAVQLIKRYRDVHFESDSENAPISIVLTTLAARHYKGDSSVYGTIMSILKEIKASIPKNGKRLIVLNPKNEREDLSERWDAEPEKYQHFIRFIDHFEDTWAQLNAQQGISNITDRLKAMFGESVTEGALLEQAAYFEKARKSNLLKVSNITGGITTIGAGSTFIKGNSFYGEE